MPSVASEALPPTFKPTLPPLPRQQPADDNAAPSPFESMLDTTQQADAPAPPANASTAEPPARSQADQKSTPAQDSKPAKDAKSADTRKADKSDKTAKADKTDATADNAKTSDAKSDGDAKTDAKTEAKADAQAAAANMLTTADTGQSADVNPIATALPAAVAVTAPAPINPIAAIANDGAAAAAMPVQVVAAKLAPAVAATVIPAAKTASAAEAGKADAKDKLEALAAQTDSDAPTDGTKIAAKPVAPAHADGKPVDTDGKQSAAPASSDHAKLDAQPAASAAPQAVPAKPEGDATQQLAMNASAQHAASSAATAPSAPAQQLNQQLMPQAVPLTGVAIEIASKAVAGKNHFDIRLDPPELGRIEVRLDVGRDGSISSHVIADRKDTLDLLQRDASGLQRAFEDAGLKTSDQGMQFSLRDHSAGQQQNMPNANTAQLIVEDETPIETLPVTYSRLAGSGGGLDIRV